jgi:general stress protein YciG
MAVTDRGFKNMDRDKQREIASKGGKAAHAHGTAHEWTTDEARAAGRKGGLASRGGKGKAKAVDGAIVEPAGANAAGGAV